MNERKYLFGSKEWWEAFVNILNSDEEYSRVAKNWRDAVILVTTNIPPNVQEYVGKDSQAVWLDLYEGKCRSFEIIEDPKQREAPITLTGSYETMKKIATGKLSPTLAVMTGRLKVKGDMMKLLRNAGASAAFVNAIKKVPTEFLA